jgi:hypothetical protein
MYRLVTGLVTDNIAYFEKNLHTLSRSKGYAHSVNSNKYSATIGMMNTMSQVKLQDILLVRF